MDKNTKTPILATGISGLVGSKFQQLYQEKYEVQNLDINHPVSPTDITKYDQVISTVSQSSANSLIHFAAFTNVTTAWEQRDNKNGLAYQVNVIGTQNIIKACQETNKHLIHISTAYVFDGESDDLYSEEDQPNPIEWYGQTKWEAEQAVMSSNINWTVLRIDQPFRSDTYERPDVVRKIINGLNNNSLPPQFSNQYFGPTFIDDFAKVIDFFIRKRMQGLFHASSGEKWSPFEFAQAVKTAHQLEGDINPGNLNNYLKTLNRPYQKNTAMSSNKLKQIIDFKMKTIKEALSLTQ